MPPCYPECCEETEDEAPISIFTKVIQGFQFGIILSCFAAMPFGAYYLWLTYSPETLIIGFGSFWLLWIVGSLLNMIYDYIFGRGEQRIKRSFPSCPDSPRPSDNDFVGSDERADNGEMDPQPSKFVKGHSNWSLVDPEDDKQIKFIREAKAKQNEFMLQQISQTSQSQRYLDYQRANPGASKLDGLSPPMPGSYRNLKGQTKLSLVSSGNSLRQLAREFDSVNNVAQTCNKCMCRECIESRQLLADIVKSSTMTTATNNGISRIRPFVYKD